MRTGKMKPAATVVIYIAVAILAVWFGVWYFSVKEFVLDFHTYRAAEDNGQSVRYVSKTGAPVIVSVNGSKRILTTEGQDYQIEEEKTPFGLEFRVRYPDGRTYMVSDHQNVMAYNENGELVMTGGIFAESGGERIRVRYGDEGLRFHPTELVHAVYPQYHQPRGYPWLYALSIPMFLFGWANFRYEWFQRAMFWASLKWIWVENPEPNDFYFIMSKISGVVIMGLALVMFFQSFSRNYDIIGVL
jgi:hypothetical protein